MTPVTDEKKLKKLIELVTYMRSQQKYYFRFRTVSYLATARKAEEQVDKYLDELQKPAVDHQKTIILEDTKNERN